MRGLYLKDGRVSYREDLPAPRPAAGTTRVRVLRAGVCATDLALARGYMDFAGTPGHEFVGEALDGPLRGARVVGEINAACGACALCREGLQRHCPQRTVLGILRHGGAFAEEIALPTANLHAVPDAVSTDAATFTEPLAAAFEIGEQIALPRGATALVAGDGKLGLLCAHALHLAGLRVTVAGRHPERSALLPNGVPIDTALLDADRSGAFALAVEATGRADVLPRLLRHVRPRGTIVLKTTIEQPLALDTALFVVNELTLVGSRCGPFAPALRALAAGQVPVERFVQARYPLAEGAAAFVHAARRGTLKVLIDVAPV
jgi:threonine dehydrogenase-like Zn-dependent dehydrogenase